jgi:hypothetical protein
MSLTGHPATIQPTQLPAPSRQTRPATPARWISRHRTAIEATATMTLAMSAPILAAVATLQT